MRSPKHYLRPSEESSFAGLSGRLSPCLAGWRIFWVERKIGATFPKQHFREQLAAGCRRTNAKPVVEEGGDRHRHETMVTTRRQAAGVVGGADEKAGGRSGAKRGGAAKRTDKADGSAVQYEFFGPTVGPLSIVVGLPAVMYALCGFCGSHGCVSLSPLKIPTFNVGTSLFSFEGFAVYLGWIFAVVSPPVPVGRAPLKSPRRTLSSRLTPNLSPAPLHLHLPLHLPMLVLRFMPGGPAFVLA